MPKLFILSLVISAGLTFNWTKYHSNLEIGLIFSEISKRCYNVSFFYNLQTHDTDETVNGNKLYVLGFGESPFHHKLDIPEVKLIANMHGNEVVGREILLQLADYICTQYINADFFIKWLLKNTRVHILPSMNPDGFDVANANDDKENNGRQNANGVDLNRNFPDSDRLHFLWNAKNFTERAEILSDYYTIPKPEIETRMIQQWLRDIPFVLSANIHGGALVANYPFDGSNDGHRRKSLTPDNAVFVNLAEAYSSYHSRMRTGKVVCKGDRAFPGGITNGANWYPVKSGMQDYNYLETNCFEVTLELGCNKFPPAEDLPRYWDENKMALLNFVLQVHSGIKGITYGYVDGRVVPLSGTIILPMNITDEENPEVINHAIYSNQGGDYFRLLTEGKYFVVAIKPGYESAFGVVEVPAPPDLKSGDYYEAKKINFLLVGSGFDQSEDLEAELSEIIESLGHGGHFRTPFMQGPEERKWLPIFLQLFRQTDVYLSTKYEI